jgi:hypothetical protein
MGRGGGEATSLQDLVTGILVADADVEEGKDQGETKLFEVQPNTFNPFEIISLGREAEETLASPEALEDPDRVRYTVGQMAIHYGWSSGRQRVGRRGFPSKDQPRQILSSNDLMIFLLDYLGNPNQEDLDKMREFIFRTNNSIEASHICRSSDSQLSYVEDHWGDDSVDSLHQVTGTSKSTVKGWLGGKSPSSENHQKINCLVRTLYELQAACGMDQDQARAWVETPNPDLPGKESPIQFLSHRTWGYPEELAKVVNSLGGDL